MSERLMRQKVVKLLKPLDATAVENGVGPGTPDINYIEGWIELKYLPRWVASVKDVKIAIFTPQQRVWLRKRWRAGGNVFFLLQAENDWLLYEGEVASIHVGKCDRDMLFEIALAYWPQMPTFEQLAPHLSRKDGAGWK
jgi:hypothetical protein